MTKRLFHCFIVSLFKEKPFSNRAIEQSSNGFTLIELLVVIAVMAILSIVGIAAFVEYSHTQAVDSAVLGVETMLQTARSDALSQVTETGGSNMCVNGNLTGYEVSLDTNNKYALYPVCNGTPSLNSLESKNLSSDPNISFSSGSTTSFTFNVLNGVTTPGTIIIANSYGIPSKKINVLSNGSISVSVQ